MQLDHKRDIVCLYLCVCVFVCVFVCVYLCVCVFQCVSNIRAFTLRCGSIYILV